MTNKTTVGVYGTLKQGHGNHRLLQHVERKAVGHVSGHRLYQRGIPFLVPDETSPYEVLVELYDVDDETLERLDMLEGHPRWYCRKELPVKLEDGSEAIAWIYEYPEPTGSENVSGVF